MTLEETSCAQKERRAAFASVEASNHNLTLGDRMNRLLLVAATVILAGCKMGNVSSELQKTRETLVQVSNTLSNAVPGEELRKLQMLAHGEDPEAAQRARDMIARLYGIQPSEFGKDYVLTASVDTPGADLSKPDLEPIRVGIVQVATNQGWSTELALNGDRITMHELGASGWRSPTREEIETKVRTHVASATNVLLGTPRPILTGNQAAIGPHRFPTGLLEHKVIPRGNNHDVIHGAIGGQGRIVIPGFKNDLERVRDDTATYNSEITSAVLSAFAALPDLPISSRSISIPWNFEDGSFLLVVIDEESWKAYEGNIVVRYSLHKKGAPADTYNQMSITTIPTGRFTSHREGEPMLFDANQLSPEANGKMKVRWGTANVVGTPASPAYKAMVSEQLAVYANKLSEEEETPWWKVW